MAGTVLTDLPKHNPCAQCGQPIVFPERTEQTQGRTAYLWHCYACDYRFEAVAFFDETDTGDALAA
jgi:ribosomal protein L37AE/L43A